MIKDKVVVITGASSGIGEASAKLLAQNGAKVVLGARRESRLQEIVDDIKKDGGQTAYKVTDVRNAQEVADLVSLAKSEFGGLDVILITLVSCQAHQLVPYILKNGTT